jgi:hypothetical protein
VFLTVALAVFLLNLILPPLVLTIARKPWDHFSFNPWLHRLPEWLASPEATVGRKLEFLSTVALFWFIASSEYDAADWGFTVGVDDLFRWVFLAVVFGAYFALWFYARGQLIQSGRGWRSGGRGGFVGILLSTLGLTTAPCSVMGCGLPVVPVLGLAFQGLTSGTMAALATFSRAANEILVIGMSAVVLVLGYLVSHESRAGQKRTGPDQHETPMGSVPAG